MSRSSPDTDSRPAILGGRPMFAQRVPIVRPVLPSLADLDADLAAMLDSGMVTKGRHLAAFEEAVALALRVKHAVAVSSCTSGLMLAYRGLGLTGEVVVPSYTFMATVSSLVCAGLRPVFAEVEGGSTNLDPAAAEKAITNETSAVVAVHNFGAPADIAGLEGVARRHGLRLVFDAAHGFGSQYQGSPVGAQGDAQVYSLSPTKLLVAAEGGIVATNNDDLAEYVRRGREYGMGDGYDSLFAGINARMSELHALLGLRGLAGLEEAVRCRQQTAALYREHLGGLPGIRFQEVRAGDRSSYKDFAIFVDAAEFGIDRDTLAAALARENIDSRKYYDPPVHEQTAYRQWGDRDESFPITRSLSRQVLCLPIWSRMDAGVVERICQAIRRIHGAAAQVVAAA